MDASLTGLEPMLLDEARQTWNDTATLCEIKADGYRLMAEVVGNTVALKTRNGAIATKWYPEVCAGLAGLTSTRTVLDGEACVFDELGRTDFEALHERSRRRRAVAGGPAVTFYVFDVLVLTGEDVRAEPLEWRKAQLQELLQDQRPGVLRCQHLPGDRAVELYRMAAQLKLEGIVIKTLNSPYVGGEPRTGYSVKVKRPGATPAKRFTREGSQLRR